MNTISRRQFLWRAGVGAGALAVGVTNPLSPTRFAFAQSAPGSDVLVCLFLRGGADGLNLVVPYTDGGYYDHRADGLFDIAVPPPDPGDVAGTAFPLEGGGGLQGFGLHPALAGSTGTGGLHGVWDAGDLAIVHACGMPATESPTRSHFEAEAILERGTADVQVSSGWLGRHLASLPGVDGGIPGLAHGYGIQASLRGDARVVSMASVPTFGVTGYRDDEGVRAVLRDLYHAEGGVLAAQNATTMDAVDLVRAEGPQQLEDPDLYQGIDARFAPVAAGFRETAGLIRADLGLRVACIDFLDWDMHDAMGGLTSGRLHTHATGLADCLGAFHRDLGEDLSRVTVVVVSEFGRCIRVNATGGTDHGRGGVSLVMGGNVNKGIWGDYPDGPLADGPEGDLTVANDLRAVLTEVLTKRLGNPFVDEVFPGYVHRGDLGVVN
jgi:uncharacterized protein (DUF1501 family)